MGTFNVGSLAQDEDIWKAIPYEVKLEIDMALDKGNKAEAVNHFMCSTKGFDFLTAKKLIEQRAIDLKQRI